jgi:hypothetical protein
MGSVTVRRFRFLIPPFLTGGFIWGLASLTLGRAPVVCFVLGIAAGLLDYLMWNLPARHKVFSDSDRLEATFRASGGSAPPELWTPDMPGRKGRKPRKKR